MAKKHEEMSLGKTLALRLYAVIYLVLGGLLAISLGTYAPEDPGFRVDVFSASRDVVFANKAGQIGAFVSDLFLSLWGYASWIIVAFLIANAIYFFLIRDRRAARGTLVSLIGLLLFLAAVAVEAALIVPERAYAWGGVLGARVAEWSRALIGSWGSLGVWGILCVVLGVFAFHLSIRKWLPWVLLFPFKLLLLLVKGVIWLLPLKKSHHVSSPLPVPMARIKKTTIKRRSVAPPKEVHAIMSDGVFHLPDTGFLVDKAAGAYPVDWDEVKKTAEILLTKLRDFGIEGEIVNASPGPVITTFEFKPASGIKISKIANLADDLTMALSSHNVRIIAPLPGKPSVGIEIPNKQRQVVYLKSLIESHTFHDTKKRIPIILGQNTLGEPVCMDLVKMPHLLVAGATGAGKSVFINTVISGLLYRFNPYQLRMILIDPKMVELSAYEGIPHLLAPVVTQANVAASTLSWAVAEMERRYNLLVKKQVRNLDDYNRSVPPEAYLPYIVIIVDEFADLMITSAKDVEYCVSRLAQKARASGIHLLLATQRPSVDVITGTIKANFPARISFKVSSKIDSRTILDVGGADRLLGKGDMLFTLSGASGLERVHGAFLSDKEIHALTGYFRQHYSAQYDIAAIQAIEEGARKNQKGGGEEDVDGADDPMFAQAVEVVKEFRIASISFLQRKLKIGYNRAARIIERMEAMGWVSPSDGTSRSREIRIPNDV